MSRKRFFQPGQHRRLAFLPVLALLCAWHSTLLSAEVSTLADALAAIRAVGPKGKGHEAAVAAWPQVAAADAAQLPIILAAMDEAGPLATNWLRGAVDTIAERQLANGEKLPLAALEEFLWQTRHASRARRLAYEWIVAAEPDASERLLDKLLDDPSLELRHDAVQRVIDQAEAEVDAKQAAAIWQRALTAARNVEQIKKIAEALKELDQPVDLKTHLGFVTRWRLIGPFDNTGSKSFDVEYPPERQLDFAASYDGQEGKAAWVDHTTDDTFGKVDLNETLGKFKGAIAYGAAEVEMPQARRVQIRLGCKNACKVWVNGQQIMAHEIYHAGTRIDQYIADAQLRAGKNTILIKVCQNEQTEPWAQSWAFQLRVTDALGASAISASPRRSAAKIARR